MKKESDMMSGLVCPAFLLFFGLAPLFGQRIDILNSGSFKGELNGKRFDAGVHFGTSENLFIIEASDEDFVLIINWPNIESIDGIEKQFVKLPAEDGRVIVNLIEKNTPSQFVITRGFMHIYRKDSQGLNGTLEFTAISRFTRNFKDQKLSLRNGNFRVDFD